MRTRIPYLAGLARQTAGQAPLRPSRRFFASDAYAPVRPPNHRPRAEGDDSVTGVVASPPGVDKPRVPAAVTSSRGENAADIAPDHLGAIAASADRPAPAGASRPDAAPAPERAGDPKLPARQKVAEPAAILPRVLPAEFTGLPTAAGAAEAMAPTATVPTVAPSRSHQNANGPAAPAQTPGLRGGCGHAADPSLVMPAIHPGAHPQMPSQSAEPAGWADTSRPNVAASPAVPPGWGMPVELPPRVDPAGAVPADAVGSPGVIPGVSLARDSVADPPSRTSAIRDLMPPPAPASPATAQSGNAKGGHRNAGGLSRASVSIGTLEITVLPPPAPAPASGDVPIPAQPAPSQAVVGSALAVGTASDRLRDGMRRWYGTAQG